MKRILSSLVPAALALAFSVPALARPVTDSSSSTPSCDGDEKKKDGDKTKNPSANPSCGEGKDSDKKDDKKGQSRF